MVDGAGGGYGATVLRHHGDVRGAVVLRQVELRLVVVGRVRGAVRDLFTQLVGVESRSHVLDHLEQDPALHEESRRLFWREKALCGEQLTPVMFRNAGSASKVRFA